MTYPEMRSRSAECRKGLLKRQARGAGTTGPFRITGGGTGGDGQLSGHRGGGNPVFTATPRRAQRDRDAVGVRCP